MMSKSLYSVLTTLLYISLNAQTVIHPNQYLTPYIYIKTDSTFSTNTSIKPYLIVNIHPKTDIPNFFPDNTSLFIRKLFNEHLIKIDSHNYTFIIDPLLHFEYGKENNYDLPIYENTRGFVATGNVNNKLFFHSELRETQTRMPTFIQSFVDIYEVSPGNLHIKEFKEDGYDYATAYGTLWYIPNKHFILRLGRDKLFIGNGYRSLLLSHNTPGYTHLSAELSFENINYTFIVASLQNTRLGSFTLPPLSSNIGFQHKYASFSYLTLFPNKKLSISMFESVIWRQRDSASNKLRFQYFNPLIYSSTAYYGLSSRNNAILGINLLYSPLSNLNFYSQFVIDDISDDDNFRINKTGFQVGASSQHTFGLRNLHTSAEYNIVSPATYSHNNSLQSYTHYNHALAHPMGANFSELILAGSLQYKRWVPYGIISYANISIGNDSTTLGQNVFSENIPNLDNNSFFPSINQSNTKILYITGKLHYIINTSTYMNVFAGITIRSWEQNHRRNNSLIVTFGLSTSLRHFYNDFSWL